MSLIHSNPYLAESFARHLVEKTAAKYCSRGVNKRMARAKARRDLEKLANVQAVPVLKNFLSNLSKSFSGAADDLVKSVDAGGTKLVATNAGEAAENVAKATKGTATEAAKDVAGQTQALPRFQAAEGQKLTFGEGMKMRGANLLNAAAESPGVALGLGAAGIGATGLATGAMLS